MAKKKQAPAALQYLDPSFFEHSPKHRAAAEEARANQEIARALYDLRVQAGLSHKDLARASGVTARTLQKLEANESPRQSLSLLRQIAAALGKRVELKLVAQRKGRARKAAAHAEPSRGRTGSTPTKLV